MNKVWNWLITRLGIADLRIKQAMTQRHCHALQEKIDDFSELINVGVDVGYHDSWSVVCIRGNKDYIQFYKLPSSDIMEIQRFLKRYARSNKIIDSPPSYLELTHYERR